MANTNLVPGATTKDQLRSALDKLAYFTAKVPGTDPRIIGMWRSRVSRLESQIVIEDDLDKRNKSEVELRVKEKYEPSPARSPGFGQRVRAGGPKRKGSMYCLCGCGKANNVGSRFQQGHDARLKAKFRELSIGTLKHDDLPLIVKSILSDPGQKFFSICKECKCPFLGEGEIGPVCQAKSTSK